MNKYWSTGRKDRSRVAQWKRAGPITREPDRETTTCYGIYFFPHLKRLNMSELPNKWSTGEERSKQSGVKCWAQPRGPWIELRLGYYFFQYTPSKCLTSELPNKYWSTGRKDRSRVAQWKRVSLYNPEVRRNHALLDIFFQ
ncbi:hypothetical protein AVEN_164107-1 [Araneus ventricosus]|uniref:Uncharacterized protein n=1 Tax=Araneus ventricosus TaxID=182803 RepID=A0A4Y2NPJ7_ARAVE|nr:hypothetical protein AVEN_164107-1 [Araneus ventricosus]